MTFVTTVFVVFFFILAFVLWGVSFYLFDDNPRLF